jgi:hypothetical protein
MGNGKWEMGNGKWEMGNGKWEMGNGKWDFGFRVDFKTLLSRKTTTAPG